MQYNINNAKRITNKKYSLNNSSKVHTVYELLGVERMNNSRIGVHKKDISVDRSSVCEVP